MKIPPPQDKAVENAVRPEKKGFPVGNTVNRLGGAIESEVTRSHNLLSGTDIRPEFQVEKDGSVGQSGIFGSSLKRDSSQDIVSTIDQLDTQLSTVSGFKEAIFSGGFHGCRRGSARFLHTRK